MLPLCLLLAPPCPPVQDLGLGDLRRMFPAVSDARAAGFADLDMDGAVDAILSLRETLFVAHGQGDGAFEWDGREFPVTGVDYFSDSYPSFLGVFDVENDGDFDVLFDGVAQLDGTLRHVAWRTLAARGRTLVLEVYGSTRTPWSLAGSALAGEVALPPFGLLFLDPAAFFVAAGGIVPADGKVELTISVPTTPGLAGAPFYWQAVAGLPLGLSNRETTTIVSL
ncbi:MAG: VCBS repeat-containing protein [Planctomycetota bacterium]